MANKFREKPIRTEQEELKAAEPVVEKNAPPEKPKKQGKKGVLAKGLSSVFGGSFLSNEKHLKWLHLFCF